MFTSILEIFVLVTALSVDAFTAGFAYGVSKIKVPPASVIIVTAVSSLTLILSLFAGEAFSNMLPGQLTEKISFVILFVLGLVKLFDRSGHKEADAANKNKDDLVSPGEAVTLGAALSIDSVAAGIGAGVMTIHIPGTFCASFLVGAAAIVLGGRFGGLISSKCDANLYWISGILLILLAFMKIL